MSLGRIVKIRSASLLRFSATHASSTADTEQHEACNVFFCCLVKNLQFSFYCLRMGSLYPPSISLYCGEPIHGFHKNKGLSPHQLLIHYSKLPLSRFHWSKGIIFSGYFPSVNVSKTFPFDRPPIPSSFMRVKITFMKCKFNYPLISDSFNFSLVS